MEQLLERTNDTGTLLAALVVMLACHLLFRMGEFAWKVFQSRGKGLERAIEGLKSSMDSLKASNERLESKIHQTDKDLNSTMDKIDRFNQDLTKMFTAIKLVAGEDWSRIRKVIMEGEMPQ